MPLFRRKKEKTLPLRKDKPKGKKEEKEKKQTFRKKREISIYSQAFNILRRPCITEKGTTLSALNKYVFEVAPPANKIEIKKAVEGEYGVKVIKVNIVKQKGKKRGYGRSIGRTRAWKKAIVTLKAGDTIELFKGV